MSFKLAQIQTKIHIFVPLIFQQSSFDFDKNTNIYINKAGYTGQDGAPGVIIS